MLKAYHSKKFTFQIKGLTNMNKEIERHDKLKSETLAELIIDGLTEAGLLKKENFDEAVKIATLEIDVRKTAGDY